MFGDEGGDKVHVINAVAVIVIAADHANGEPVIAITTSLDENWGLHWKWCNFDFQTRASEK